MKIEKIYVYPIKSLRGIELPAATVNKYGLEYDRRFMLLKVDRGENGEQTYQNMIVSRYNELVRFFPEFASDESGNDVVKITHKPVSGGGDKTIEVPLVPETKDLELTEITLWDAATKAYLIPGDASKWFSDRLGYDAVLAYVGEHRRKVRMSTEGNRRTPAPEVESTSTSHTSGAGGWLSSTFSSITSATASLVGFGYTKAPEITFTDVAPFLIASSKSMEDVDRRLNRDGKENPEHFDITKFRPNIVVSGADQPWDEDFWAELIVSPASGQSKDERVVFKCEGNCGRCRSINIDYNTGKQGEGEAGKMLKKLSSDRRVDPGNKWNPIFGRYGFLGPQSEGRQVRVGDDVEVSVRYKERTRFDWDGLCTP